MNQGTGFDTEGFRASSEWLEQTSWCGIVCTRECYVACESTCSLTLVYDSSVEEAEEVILTDEKINEGIGSMEIYFGATVVGTEVTREAMVKFIKAHWLQVPPSSVTK